MPVDVSVVVPFFNPGANIEDCIASLLAQTLPRQRFNVVLVDDGSTDGSLARVQKWVSRYPDLLSVRHIAASGGPGRPRNVGIEHSTGRFIQFLDSDDILAPRALERVLEIADASDADVVVGKLSSDFRGIHHPMFRQTLTHRTLDDFPLMLNLTVCKMFRREFLVTHVVRFPEGPHYVEDQHFCLQAYAHARSVAIVGDTVCYFYRRRRTGGRNFGDSTIVLADYFRELDEILDLIDTQVASATTRIAVQTRFYRNELLGRLRGQAMLTYDAEYRRDLVFQVRRLATTRLSAGLHDGLPAFHRAQSRLLLDDNLDGLIDFARHAETIRLRATTTTPRWQDGLLVVGVEAHWTLGGEPLELQPDREDWLLPESLAPTVGASDRRLGTSDDSDLDLATISRADSALWSTTDGLSLDIDADGHPRVVGEVRLDPNTVMGGAVLNPGEWNLRLRVMFAGLTRTAPLRPEPGTEPTNTAWVATSRSGLHSVSAVWAGSSPTLGLDVDQWSHALHDIVVDRLAAPPYLDDEGQLVIAASDLYGPPSAAPYAAVTFEPIDSPDVGVVTRRADLVISPDGSTIRAAVADLPASVRRWAVWLRIGELGAAPPRRLPIELAAIGPGELRIDPLSGR